MLIATLRLRSSFLVLSALATRAATSMSQLPTSLAFGPLSASGTAAPHTVLIGRRESLLSASVASLLPPGCSPVLWRALVEGLGEAGDAGKTASSYFISPDNCPSTVAACLLPDACSRHASPVRGHALTALVGSAVGSAAETQCVAVLDELVHAAGTAGAIARAFPLFSAKRGAADARAPPAVRVALFAADAGGLCGEEAGGAYAACAAAADGVRLAARLVDTDPSRMTTTALVAEALAAAERLRAGGKVVAVEVVSGDELLAKGYGLLHAVGRAAVEPPALVVLSHVPAAAQKTVALVGKGIVYDTGGLALKSREGMCGMKADMGGAAAMLGAFEAAVRLGTRATALHLVLCVAENAIGPAAFRNDDVLTGLSGRSVEINNSDAEGRLVLADGVAHCTALPPRLPGLAAGAQPDLVVDMATLTGAQMIATGKRHAAIVANLEAVEAAAVAAGRVSGDLVHALPFAPELYRKEFASKVACMKNSVKDRANAQASCAATFVHAHLHPDYAGGWLHVDMAGPSFLDDRATGYGVNLVLALLDIDGCVAPPAKSE